MVLNESELFTLHSPRLLMNTSILFWKIVPPSCGIFFNAVNRKLEAGKPRNEEEEEKKNISHYLKMPLLQIQPCWPASPSSYTPPGPNSKHLFLNLLRAEATEGSHPAHLCFSPLRNSGAGGLQLCRVGTPHSIWKGADLG